MQHQSIALGFVLAATGAFAQTAEPIAEPLLPVIQPQFPSTSPVWNDLFDALPAVSATIEPFEAGWSYRSCMNESSLSNYDSFNILFDDCPSPWQVCLKRDIGISPESVAEMLGKLPGSYRQYVRDLTVHDGFGAFWRDTTLVISKRFWNIAALVHEASHAVDLLDTETLGPIDTPAYSSTREWRDAYYASQSAATTGSNYDWLENFAEMGPRLFYDLNVEGGLANFQPNWEEFGTQLEIFRSMVEDKAQVGGTCSFRIQNTPAIPIPDAEGKRRSTASAPDTGFTSDIRVLNLRDNLPLIACFKSD